MIRKAAVDSGALIPDRQIVLAPSPSRMKSGFFDMSPEECQKCIALGLREFDDLSRMKPPPKKIVLRPLSG